MIKKFDLLFIITTSSLVLLFTGVLHKTIAFSFVSQSYHIDWGNFNVTGGKKTSTNYQLTDSVGQNAPGQFNNTGFILKSGFQYAYEGINQFSFFIDDLYVDLGLLTPGIGSTDTNIITITTPSGKGYEILAMENHPFTILGTGITIPDTRCDSGTCSESSSGVWTSNTAYGFGFNAIGINSSGVATGIGTSNYFLDNTYYRQFANTQAGETPQIIMSESNSVEEHSARITYKALISTLQAAGNYQNSINFIAVPKY